MGHKYEKKQCSTMSWSSLVWTANQFIHGRKKCLDLYKESSSTMSNRNLRALKPPGSILAELPYERVMHILEEKEEINSKVVSTMLIPATHEYGLRRQEKVHQKDRRGYLE